MPGSRAGILDSIEGHTHCSDGMCTYLGWIPDTFACSEIRIHMLFRTRLYDFDPFYPEIEMEALRMVFRDNVSFI